MHRLFFHATAFAQRHRPILLALALGIVTLAWRAALDKILALRGGPELIATWGQLQSVADLVSNVTSAGIAPGVAVLVAQASTGSERHAVLRHGLRLGAMVGGVALAAVVFRRVAAHRFMDLSVRALRPARHRGDRAGRDSVAAAICRPGLRVPAPARS